MATPHKPKPIAAFGPTSQLELANSKKKAELALHVIDQITHYFGDEASNGSFADRAVFHLLDRQKTDLSRAIVGFELAIERLKADAAMYWPTPEPDGPVRAA